MNPSLGGKITQLQNRITRLSERIFCSTAIMEASIQKSKEELSKDNSVSGYHSLSEAEFAIKRLRIHCKQIAKELLANVWKEK